MKILSKKIDTLIVLVILFSCFIIFPANIYSQDEDIETDPVQPVTDLIKFSNAVVKNNLYHDGKVYGYINGEKRFIKDFASQETFTFETENFDSAQFYSEFSVEGTHYIVDGFFLKIADNKPFEFTPTPVIGLTGLEMIVDNSVLKGLSGKKLYEITIKDDVNSDLIEAAATSESAPYIDVLRIDTVTYHIKLKMKDEFLRNVSDDDKKKWSKGEEVIFPIGIVLSDKSIPSDVQEYKLFLKKKKKPKKSA